MDTLNSEVRRKLMDALNSAFSTSTLQQMLKLQLNEDLEKIVSLTNNRQTIIFDLVKWAEQRGRVGDLVEAAYQDNPTNQALRDLAEVVWPNCAMAGGRPPRLLEALCGVAPGWSLLEDVHKAFGQPDSASVRLPTRITAVYAANGVDVTCLPGADRRWVVDVIRMQAPCAQRLAFSGLYIGMPLDDLRRACNGKYHFDANGLRYSNLVLEPMQNGNCRLTVVLDAAKASFIFMKRSA